MVRNVASGADERAALVGMPPRQRSVARETAHQLVSGFERCRSQLGLDQAPEHAGVVLDETTAVNAGPVKVAAEPSSR